jgi:hypothetical protein
LATPPDEQVLTGCLLCDPYVVIDGLPGLLGELEAYRATGLPLPHGSTVGGVAVRSDVIDLDGDDIAAAQLAVDRQVEHREVTCSSLDVEPRSDRPNVLRPERGLCADQLALVPGNTRRLRGKISRFGHGQLLSC